MLFSTLPFITENHLYYSVRNLWLGASILIEGRNEFLFFLPKLWHYWIEKLLVLPQFCFWDACNYHCALIKHPLRTWHHTGSSVKDIEKNEPAEELRIWKADLTYLGKYLIAFGHICMASLWCAYLQSRERCVKVRWTQRESKAGYFQCGQCLHPPYPPPPDRLLNTFEACDWSMALP